MKEMPQSPAAAFYLQVARITASFLASSSTVESVLVHRSVATGEVSFGRSDIDLLMVVGQAASEDGEKLVLLYKRVRLYRCVNPAVNHIEVVDAGSLSNYAEADTWWASLERRSAMLLRGKPITIPSLPIDPDHVVAKLGFWLHWFISPAIQRRGRRNLRKNALECWNMYATAAGLIPEPCLTRAEMAKHLCTVEKGISVERLEDAPYAIDFVFDLASRLHRQRLPALERLSKPLVFEAILAPLSHQRIFVVLSGPRSPLPPEAFLPGSFVCTPEILDLFLHYSDTFLHWVLPAELRELGMKPPSLREFLQTCRVYVHSRFLRHPGFLIPNSCIPFAVISNLKHALDYLSGGEIRPPIPQQEMRRLLAKAPPYAWNTTGAHTRNSVEKT